MLHAKFKRSFTPFTRDLANQNRVEIVLSFTSQSMQLSDVNFVKHRSKRRNRPPFNYWPYIGDSMKTKQHPVAIIECNMPVGVIVNPHV